AEDWIDVEDQVEDDRRSDQEVAGRISPALLPDRLNLPAELPEGRYSPLGPGLIDAALSHAHVSGCSVTSLRRRPLRHLAGRRVGHVLIETGRALLGGL